MIAIKRDISEDDLILTRIADFSILGELALDYLFISKDVYALSGDPNCNYGFIAVNCDDGSEFMLIQTEPLSWRGSIVGRYHSYLVRTDVHDDESIVIDHLPAEDELSLYGLTGKTPYLVHWADVVPDIAVSIVLPDMQHELNRLIYRSKPADIDIPIHHLMYTLSFRVDRPPMPIRCRVDGKCHIEAREYADKKDSKKWASIPIKAFTADMDDGTFICYTMKVPYADDPFIYIHGDTFAAFMRRRAIWCSSRFAIFLMPHNSPVPVPGFVVARKLRWKMLLG